MSEYFYVRDFCAHIKADINSFEVAFTKLINQFRVRGMYDNAFISFIYGFTFVFFK